MRTILFEDGVNPVVMVKNTYPMFEIQMPSGRTSAFRASEVFRIPDQDDGRSRFYE